MALLQALIGTGRQDGRQITGEETLAYPVHTRYLRFYGAFANSARLRLEVYGCVSDNYSQCTLPINNIMRRSVYHVTNVSTTRSWFR